MKRIRTPSFTSPYLSWTRLAWKTGETMLASAQVIQHRTGRMVAAGAKPSARDRRGFALMGQEKIETGMESASAMAAQTMAMNSLLGMRAVKNMMTGAAAVMSLAPSQTASQAMARHTKVVRIMAESGGQRRAGFRRRRPTRPARAQTNTFTSDGQCQAVGPALAAKV